MTSECEVDTKLHTLPSASAIASASPIATATAIAVSFAICSCAVFFTKLSGVQGSMIPIATAIVVVLATVFPPVFNYLAPSAEVISSVLMQVNTNK